jgi:PAS domain S-box-containing protein
MDFLLEAELDVGEAPFEMTFPLRRAGGVFRPFMTRVAPVCDADGHLRRSAELADFDRWVAHVHPDDRAELLANWERAVVSPGSHWTNVYRFRQPDGGWRWINTHTLVIGEAGRAVKVVGVVQDITGRKRIEEALRESEARLQVCQDAGQIGSWDWDLITNQLHWSEAQCRQFGVDSAKKDQVLYEQWRAAVHPDDLAAAEAKFPAAFQSGGNSEIEYRIVTPRGIRWMNGRGFVQRDASGKAVRMIGVDIDFTERKRIEEALQSSEGRVQPGGGDAPGDYRP